MTRPIPVIDVAPLSRPEEEADLHEVVSRISAGCRDWGFFQVVNHGVPQDLVERVWGEARSFFSLPREAKLALARTAENPRGYYDRELTKNVRDLKEVFDFAAADGSNQWPASLETFKPTMMEYFEACERLSQAIFEGFCLGLGLPRDHLHRHFIGHTSFVRLNHYPLEDPLDAEDSAGVTGLGDLALGHHTDAGALTILLQDDVGGLQVFDGEDWLDVDPLEGAFVINIGDMTQVWSNDRYRAALHRVRPLEGRARLSVPFFYNPSYDTDCAPLPGVGAEEPRYRPVNWGEFRRARTAGDYADYGVEIQIEDFRLP